MQMNKKSKNTMLITYYNMQQHKVVPSPCFVNYEVPIICIFKTYVLGIFNLEYFQHLCYEFLDLFFESQFFQNFNFELLLGRLFLGFMWNFGG
jgi:hypothetical protein